MNTNCSLTGTVPTNDLNETNELPRTETDASETDRTLKTSRPITMMTVRTNEKIMAAEVNNDVYYIHDSGATAYVTNSMNVFLKDTIGT